MDNDRFEQLSIIRDEILTDPNVDASLIWDAAKLALEDDYLNEMLVSWMKETDSKFKSDTLNEVVNYTEEILRKRHLENASN